MNKYWIYVNTDKSCTIFYDWVGIPIWMQNDVHEVDILPEGEGILRQANDGSFYYEPFLSVEEPPTEPQVLLGEMQAKTLLNTEVLLAMKNIGV